MRILLVTSALASHYFAMVPFGWAARVHGHEVTVATTPDLVPVVRDSGLPGVARGLGVGDPPSDHVLFGVSVNRKAALEKLITTK